jgi:hypothetical protein
MADGSFAVPELLAKVKMLRLGSAIRHLRLDAAL